MEGDFGHKCGGGDLHGGWGFRLHTNMTPHFQKCRARVRVTAGGISG